MTSQEQQSAFDELASTITDCTACPLHQTRTQALPGSGPINARVFLVGRAPVYHEDKQGIPFAGSAGRFLEKLLELAGLTRDEVFLCNIVRCRPPENRQPTPAEIEACLPYLEQQLTIVQPQVVVPVGPLSTILFFPEERLSRIHGQVFEQDERLYFPVMHPADIIRNPRMRPVMEADFERLGALLNELAGISPPEPETEDISDSEPESEAGATDHPEDDPPSQKPQQLSLF